MTSLAEIETAINRLGYGTPEYHDAMAMFLMILARAQWRQADLARALQDRRKTWANKTT